AAFALPAPDARSGHDERGLPAADIALDALLRADRDAAARLGGRLGVRLDGHPVRAAASVDLAAGIALGRLPARDARLSRLWHARAGRAAYRDRDAGSHDA